MRQKSMKRASRLRILFPLEAIGETTMLARATSGKLRGIDHGANITVLERRIQRAVTGNMSQQLFIGIGTILAIPQKNRTSTACLPAFALLCTANSNTRRYQPRASALFS